MFEKIVNHLRCPQCSSELELSIKSKELDEVLEGTLTCKNKHVFTITDGVINFNSKEQELMNNWSSVYEKYDYKEVDEMIAAKVPNIQKEGNRFVIESIKEYLKNNESKYIVDIATGRGLLLMELVKDPTLDLDIVCVDLSHTVLKYDRLKCMEVNSKCRINFIACDATNLPFKDQVFDQSVSFFGIANMLNLAQQGISEAIRVSKNGLLNTTVIIKDDNPHIEAINQMLKDAGYEFTLDFALQSNNVPLHQINQLTKVNETIVFEGIAEKYDDDLLPIENEWFGLTLVEVK